MPVARWLSLLLALLLAATVHGQEPASPPAPPRPPSNVRAHDVPNDAGTALRIEWAPSPDDSTKAALRRVEGYRVYRIARSKPDEPVELELLLPGTGSLVDSGLDSDEAYKYRVVALGSEGAASPPAESDAFVSPQVQWFDRSRTWYGILLVLVCGAIIGSVYAVRWGMPVHFRRIAGLEAIEEAVGRATEMGKPCLFIPGILDVDDIQTVAGITVLRRVAHRIAEYDADLKVPCTRSLVMTAARQATEAAYLEAGRPEAYQEDRIYYVTDEQFGYVAAVAGEMVREKPAACFYMGAFYAESLVLAETGNSIGAIQVAGTGQPHQLPFFVAACDYTLIGEEFFAASAYLSGEPDQLGSLVGQDLGKFLGLALIALGCGLATLAAAGQYETLQRWADYLRTSILG